MRSPQTLQAVAPVTYGLITHSEIFQQPDLWKMTLGDERLSHVPANCPTAGILITGAGSSAYAAAAVSKGLPGARAVPTTDLLVDPDILGNAQLLISLARSGDSPESLAVVRQVKRLNPTVRHLVITCNREGRLANLSDVESIVLDPRTNDQSLVMTASFTNLVLAGLCLKGRSVLLREIDGICNRAPLHLERLEEIAAGLADCQSKRVLFLASAPLFPLAQEASLKLLEMTAGRVVSIAETFLGLRHGPMSFVQEDTLVFGLLSSDLTRRSYERDLLTELQRKGLGKIVLVGDWDHTNCLDWLSVPSLAPNLPDFFRSPFEAVFFQLLAFRFSLRCGLNPDQPSPNAIISRVVGDFFIHEPLLPIEPILG